MGVLPVGTMFHGHYEVLSVIKAGGMGAVYQVLDHRTRRRRALKLMLPSIVADPEMRRRFKLEATVTSDIESEHIVETFDAGVDPGTGAPFLVMELLRGDDLAGLLEKRGRLEPAEVVLLLYQAAHALDRTHAAGVVHRDLKPENLFVTSRDDGSPRLKVLDFGIAKVVAQSSAAKTTRSLGTPLYMAPEQIKGSRGIGPRADVYALGHIAYTLLTGDAYWAPEAGEADGIFAFFTRVLEGPRVAPTQRAGARSVALPPAFDAWFASATAVDSARRFATAPELVEALSRTLGVPMPTPLSNPSAPTGAAYRATLPSDPRGVAAPGSGRAPQVSPVALAPTIVHHGAPPAPPVALGGHTTSPVSSTQGFPDAPPPAKPGRTAIAVVGAAALLLTLAGTGGATVWYVFHHRADVAARTPVEEPAAGAGLADPPREVASTAPASPATASASAARQIAPGVSASIPAPSTTTKASAGPVRSSTTGAPTPPPARPAASAKPSCDPPFYFDDTGRKIFKRECTT